MNRLELLMIDCWGTIVLDNPVWDNLIADRIAQSFDLHGAVHDEALRKAVAAEAEQFRRILVDREVTPTAQERLSFILDQLDLKVPKAAIENTCRAIMQCIRQPLPQTVTGAESFIERMHGRPVKLALICNTGWFSGAAITTALNELGIANRLDYLVFSDAFGAAKPSRSIFDHALKLADCRPANAAHIGDTWSTDVVGAQRAGVFPIQLLGEQSDLRDGEHECATSFDEVYDSLRRRFRC